MLRYFLKRLAAVVPLVLLVSLICFALMQATPGGPTAVLSANPMVGPDDVARIRSKRVGTELAHTATGTGKNVRSSHLRY